MNPIHLYCVDLGYGYVKTIGKNPFPSVVYKTTSSDFSRAQDFVDSSNPFLITYNNGVYALGETARASTSNPETIMEGNGRWESDAYVALMLGGIINQMPKGDVYEDIFLVTGLPYLQSKNIEEVNGLKNTFKRKFVIAVLENGKPVTKVLNIVDVHVLSQPRAAYYALLGMTGKRVKVGLALIADLGFKSLDYLVTSDGQETNESNGEDSIAGMERIYTTLIRDLRSEGLPAVKPHELDSWIEKGHLDKHKRLVDRHFKESSKIVVRDIKEKLGAFWERIELMGSIYFVGGSSKRLQPFLEEELPGVNVYFSENPQQLIVEGYAAYGRAMMNKLYGGARLGKI